MSELKVIAERNEELTDIAKSVFGEDLVLSAYVTTATYSKEELNWEVYIELQKAASNYFGTINNELDLDTKDIIIQFCNGRHLYFTNSEWGSISIINEFEIY